jgi:hypothetical protein
MKIEKNMALADLAQHMGSEATEAEASAMRDILIGRGYEGEDIAEIGDGEWMDMLRQVAQ